MDDVVAWNLRRCMQIVTPVPSAARTVGGSEPPPLLPGAPHGPDPWSRSKAAARAGSPRLPFAVGFAGPGPGADPVAETAETDAEPEAAATNAMLAARRLSA